MHHSGPFPLVFKSPEQGFGDKNCQNESQGKPWGNILEVDVMFHVQMSQFLYPKKKKDK